MHLLERYETELGIYNHDVAHPDVDESLATLLMHPQEDPMHYSYLYARMDDYVGAEVMKYLNLTFDKFLQYPRHVVEAMLNFCENRQKEDLAIEQGKLRKAEAAMQQARGNNRR